MNSKKQFLKFVIPSVLSMLIFNLYTMVDGIYVAQIVGETALSAVNISIPYTNFIFAFALLFAVGTSTVVAIYRGQGDLREANETFTKNTVFLSVCGLLVTVFAVLNLETLARFLGASETTMPYVKDYLGIIVWFSYFYIVSYSLEVLVKTDGFPMISTLGVFIGAMTNIILDAVFMILFDMGIAGAALATGLSQVLTFSVFFIHFLRHKGSIRWCRFQFDFRIYKRIIPIGLADFITELSAGIIVFMFNHAILTYIGDAGLVTYTIITYVYNLVMMTFSGISQGMQPLVSYHYGKQDVHAYHTFFKYALFSTLIASLFALVICLFGTKWIVMIFLSPDSQPLFSNTLYAFRCFSLCYLVIGYNIVIAGYFAAVEKSRNSFLISVLRGFVLIAFALFFTSYCFGGEGIWFSTLICEGLCLIVSLFLILRQKKQERATGKAA